MIREILNQEKLEGMQRNKQNRKRKTLELRTKPQGKLTRSNHNLDTMANPKQNMKETQLKEVKITRGNTNTKRQRSTQKREATPQMS